MEQERADYADPDRRPPRVDVALLGCIVLGVAILAACAVWNRLAPFSP